MRKNIYILFLLFLLSISYGQVKNHIGIGFNVGYRGAGIHAYSNKQWKPDLYYGYEFRIFDIKGKNEMVYTDRYTGRTYTFNEQNLFPFPILSTITYYPFFDKIDNNFSPFVSIKPGINFILDGDEMIDSDFKRLKKARGYFDIGGQIAIGAQIYPAHKTLITLSIGYDIFPMSEPIDNSNDYNGMIFQISFSRFK